MEVDRVTQMGGVGRDSGPSWPKSALRRRKFTVEVEEALSEDEEPQGEAHAALPDEDEGHDAALDVMA